MDELDRLLQPHPRLRVARYGLPDPRGACVLYWMQRSQRGTDNPALNLAIDAGNALGVPVIAAFGLTADYPGAQRRHYRFLLEGLLDVAKDLRRRNVTLVVRLGSPDKIVAALSDELRPRLIVGDENPVRVGQQWRDRVARHVKAPFYLVDGDVVVPSSQFPHEEYAARTLRPKIHRLRDDYLLHIPNPKAHVPWVGPTPRGVTIDPSALLEELKVGAPPR